MADYNALVNVFKSIANETVTASAPVAVCFGTVTSETPLKIIVDQKLELSEMQLVLTRNVTDYTTVTFLVNTSCISDNSNF